MIQPFISSTSDEERNVERFQLYRVLSVSRDRHEGGNQYLGVLQYVESDYHGSIRQSVSGLTGTDE